MKKVKRKNLTLSQRRMRAGYLFILPWMFGVLVFFIYNAFQAGVYSFNSININLDGTGYTLSWMGLENYRFALFTHGTFNRELVETIFQMIWSVPLVIFFSLFIAILLKREFMFRGLVRVIFFLPVVLATPAIQGALETMAMIMGGGLTSAPPDMAGASAGLQAGMLAQLIEDFGVPVHFTSFILDSVARIHEVVRASGVQILIFLAALQAIPASMYEVARIEGATGYETFWKITFPMISPLILTNVVYTIVDGFAGSPVIDTAFRVAFVQQNFGLSSAMSIISSAVVLLFLFITVYLISRKVFYQNA